MYRFLIIAFLSILQDQLGGFFFCSSIPVVVFDNPGISKCLNTVISSLHLSFIIGIICDLSVARNDSWIPPHGPNKYGFTTMEAEGEGWDPIKLA